MATGRSNKLWLIPTGIAFLLTGCSSIQFIPMDIEGQADPRRLNPTELVGFNAFDPYLPIDRIIKKMVTEFTLQNPDIAIVAVRDFRVFSGQLYHGIIEERLVNALHKSKDLSVVSFENRVTYPMITDGTYASITDMYDLGFPYHGVKVDGYLDGSFLDEGRLYTLRLRLIHADRNDVIWSKTIIWSNR